MKKDDVTLAAQIIPADDTPGAKEAGCLHFIDRALSTFDKQHASLYAKGLKSLDGVSRKLFPKKGTFVELKPDQQVKVIKGIEKSEFFETVRGHTVIGFMAKA